MDMDLDLGQINMREKESPEPRIATQSTQNRNVIDDINSDWGAFINYKALLASQANNIPASQ